MPKIGKAFYPGPKAGHVSKEILLTAPRPLRSVVDALCYQPFAEIGNKTIADVYRFGQKEQRMIEECAQRLAAGTDPGIVPERFSSVPRASP